MREHAKLSYAIHNEAARWRSAMRDISRVVLEDYIASIPGQGNEPRIRVWKRIVLQEQERRKHI